MKRRTFKRVFWLAGAFAALCAAVFLLRFGVGKYYNIRYPLEYSERIEASARENGLPPSFVYAVVHTESRFDPRAVSQVDARGLMQISRDAFDWVQFRMGLSEPLDYDEYCFDPEVNVRYGTYLLKLLYDEFGSYDLALCAYHAGRGNVNKWLGDPELSDDGKTVKEIPFKDTRWYVERVGETRRVYQKVYRME